MSTCPLLPHQYVTILIHLAGGFAAVMAPCGIETVSVSIMPCNYLANYSMILCSQYFNAKHWAQHDENKAVSKDRIE